MNVQLLEELNTVLKNNNLKYEKYEDEKESLTWKSKVDLTCLKCGEVFTISMKQLLRPHPIRQGLICPICEAERLYLNKLVSVYGKNPYEFISRFRGYNSPLTVRCKDCGYEFSTNLARNLLVSPETSGGAHPCKQCSNIRNFKKDIKEFEDQLVEKFGVCNYEFLSPEDFSGPYSKKKIKVKCKICGSEFETNPQNILYPKNGKHYCKNCFTIRLKEMKKASKENKNETYTPPKKQVDSNYVSTAKKDLKEWIKTIYSGEIKFDCDEISKTYPVDIYVPEKKIAVDLCILKENDHYHVDKKFHINRTYAYDEANVRLIQIFEDEWESRQEIVKKKLTTIFGKNSDTVYARNCTLVDVNSAYKNAFMNSYHIQGEDRAAFTKGLAYDGEIVAIMTFIKPRLALGSKTGKTENEYELSRYASSKRVVGGFSKLFRAILSEHPDIEKVKTFADIRWSSLKNNVYLKNGFVEKHISDPNYWYFDTTNSGKDLRRIHRFNFRKQELTKKFPKEYDPNLTEFQIMDKTNYARIFDCGNLVFEYIV